MLVVFLTAVVCGKFSGKCYVNNFTHISTPPLRTSSHPRANFLALYFMRSLRGDLMMIKVLHFFSPLNYHFFFFVVVVCVFDPSFTVHTHKNSIIIPSNLMKISYAQSTTDLASVSFLFFSLTPDRSIKKKSL